MLFSCEPETATGTSGGDSEEESAGEHGEAIDLEKDCRVDGEGPSRGRSGSSAEEWKAEILAASSDKGVPVPGKEFQSYFRRMPLPCMFDIEIIPQRALAVRESTEDVLQPMIRLVDEYGQCCNMQCRRITRPLREECAGARRVALVRWDGTHMVEVRDWTCGACGKLNRFEGLGSA